MVGYLTIAMAKTVQIHICHILASIGWHLLWPWCQNNLILQKKLGFSFLAIKKGEGSLHPRPKGRGIRDPPHSLCNKIEVIVANPYQIKNTPGRKTDQRDSEWIAELCLKGMIEPSRIFPKEDRELRNTLQTK
jgi:hypothetical protein